MDFFIYSSFSALKNIGFPFSAVGSSPGDPDYSILDSRSLLQIFSLIPLFFPIDLFFSL